MKRVLFSWISMAIALISSAQSVPDTSSTLDPNEDLTQVVTVADIVAEQEIVTSGNSLATHFNNVWSRNSYFNVAYNSATLKPNGDISLGYNYNGDKVPDFKSDWGVSVQLGRNYRLHKRAIANMVQFNLDFTYIDLNVNHFKAEPGEKLYDSAKKNGDHYYIPWCLQKYEANYGMTLGPSITVAPFTKLDIPQLHFLKLNLYYHIGYHVSMLLINNDKQKDANPDADSVSYSDVNSSIKMNLGHGLINSFGFNLSWKSIGVGYEIRTGKLDYQSIQKDIFGKAHYKFNATTNRVYLELRY